MSGSQATPTGEIARFVRIDGRVQGVGFRWHTRLEARALRLTGWVRNRDDGSVEAHIQGPAATVQELLRWLERGPSGAHVDSVEPQDVALEFGDTFEIR